MSDIPNELFEEILARLPVKALIRFRCVSKSWRTIIGRRDFIKKHLSTSLKTNSNHILMFRHLKIDFNLESYLFTLDYDSLNETNCAIFENLNHPLKESHVLGEILGSCDGLICLCYFGETIVLWNPSIRIHQILPIPEIGVPRTGLCGYWVCNVIFGLGYDAMNDDYKVVRMRRFGGDNEVYNEVMVYSLKLDSWRKVQDFPCDLEYIRRYGMFVNGALHWVVSGKPKENTAKLIAAFDLGTDEYRLVAHPMSFDENCCLDLAVLGGCLCMIGNYYLDHVEIWVMKEYGVKESWTNLILIKCDIHTSYFETMWPIAYSKCGKQVLLQQDDKLLWYDLEKKYTSFVTRKFPFVANFFESDMFVQSLVMLNGDSCRKNRNKNQHQESNTSDRKAITQKEMTSCQGVRS